MYKLSPEIGCNLAETTKTRLIRVRKGWSESDASIIVF